ncbi:Uncharacterised protein [uncultured archaeon]|nr:Uncharacterised protein [uncultured archaeon]
MRLHKNLPIILLIIVLIYFLPAFLASYAGGHTMESANATELNCLTCHDYIARELNFTTSSRSVLNSHLQAANNTNYTTFIKYGYHYNASEGRIYTTPDPSKWDSGSLAESTTYIYYVSGSWIGNRSGVIQYATVNLERNGLPGIQMEESCIFCHSADIHSASTHTGVTVVGCTDIKCHGNSSGIGYGKEFYPTVMTGYNLSNNNVHSNWFKSMGNRTSPYDYTIHGSNVTADYFTCMGCHTYVQVNANITWPSPYMHDNFSAPKVRYP